MRPVGVTVALFLNSRTMAPNIGTLMIALESGLIQVWTHHPGAGFLEAFSAIHKYGDFVTSMATDRSFTCIFYMNFVDISLSTDSLIFHNFINRDTQFKRF